MRRNETGAGGQLDDALRAALRGDPQPLGQARSERSVQEVVERAKLHGVEVLLYDQLQQARATDTSLLSELRARAVAAMAWEAQHARLICRLVDSLNEAGVKPIIFKGTALAYDIYAHPSCRVRGDSDLLVPVEDVPRAQAALAACGFETTSDASETFGAYQSCHALKVGSGPPHVVDLHWRISNAEVLSRVLTYEELLAHSRAVPRLGRTAVAPSLPHALAIACLHRAAHAHVPYDVGSVVHYGGDRLIWLFDVHLLCEAMSESEWHEFVATITMRGLGRVCYAAIICAVKELGTRVPAGIEALLEKSGAGLAIERFASAGPLEQHWLNYRAFENGAERRRHLRRILLPSPVYMRQRYPNAGPMALPLLYVRRAVAGVLRRVGLRRPAP
jgi:hypothetical protein